MKKRDLFINILLCLMVMLLFVGCGNSKQEGNEETCETLVSSISDEIEIIEGNDIAAQMSIISDNVNLWKVKLDYADDLWKYAITDLDLDNKYEIIVSQCGGTGAYTYSRIYEINDTLDGLVEVSMDFKEGDSQPDIIRNSVAVYLRDNCYFYIFTDSMKEGAAEYYEYVSAVSLQGESWVVDPIVYKEMIIENVVVKDKSGNILPEEAYETEVTKYFAGCEKYKCNIQWKDVKELSDSTMKMRQQLNESAEQFSIM